MTEHKAPLIHLSKRKTLPWYSVWRIRILAVLLSLIVCGILTQALTGLNPIAVYKTMFYGAFGTTRKTWTTLQEIALLHLVALALAPAFRMRFWNLGGEGQILIGGLVAATCMILLGGKMPNFALLALMSVLSIAAGAVWAFIPAFFKARWNTNETLFTLMMNYVATQLVAYFIIVWEVPRGSGKIGIINQQTEAGWFPALFGQRYLLNIVAALVVALLMLYYMRVSKHGFELTVVGESERTARYIGIKVEKIITRTLILSGAVCGLVGLLLVASTNHTITTTITDGRGFTAVMVAWLAKFDPLMMILSSGLLIVLKKGASEISTAYTLNQSFGDILTGIILFFIIGCEFFIMYSVHFRKSSDKKDK